MTASGSRELETATLGGGCFWCIEAVFLDLEGVHRVQSGYSGGVEADANYERVCSGGTGHAEVVQVEFDPQVIGFREILEVFFTAHDPTTPNRQGADVGPQYRSVIFHHSPAQRKVAEEVIDALTEEGVWSAPIVTELVPFEDFYPAEAYHSEYFRRNPRQPYCQVVIEPKVAKVRERFAHRLRR